MKGLLFAIKNFIETGVKRMKSHEYFKVLFLRSAPRAFNGELTAEWHESHLVGLPEIEQQAILFRIDDKREDGGENG